MTVYDDISPLLREDCDLASTLAWCRNNRDGDVRRLALSAVPAGIDRVFALEQIAGRQKAMTKLPLWASTDGILYPVNLSMEQCSSQVTAEYKASLVEGDSIIDLTGGFGVDFTFMSRGRRGVMVERDRRIAAIARHNLHVFGREDVDVVTGDGMDYLREMSPVDVIYLDPARRDGAGNRVYAISDCTPDVTSILDLLKEKACRQVMVKLSPMADIAQVSRSLPGVTDVHIVATGGECKELLVIINKEHAREEPEITCWSDGRTFVYRPSDEVAAGSVPSIADPTAAAFLYEPDVTLMKAGCFTLLARRFGVTPVAPNSHIFVSSRLIEDFPGRRFAIERVTTLNKKEVKAALGGIDRANITTRNFPLSAVELRRRLRLADGGDIYLFATHSAVGNIIFVGRKATRVTRYLFAPLEG